MKGIDELVTIDDYYQEIKEVEKQLKEINSNYRKNDLMKYLFYLKRKLKIISSLQINNIGVVFIENRNC